MALADLQQAQSDALNNPSPLSFLVGKDLHSQWTFLRSIEESYFRQKSRINWLKEGDFNTAYFHRIAVVRAAYNTIRFFHLSSGLIIENPVAMSDHAINHFKSIMGPPVVSPSQASISWFQTLLPFRCGRALQDSMVKRPSNEEITKMVFRLNLIRLQDLMAFPRDFIKLLGIF